MDLNETRFDFILGGGYEVFEALLPVWMMIDVDDGRQ